MGANAQTSVPLYAAAEILTAANMNISAGTGVPVFATTVTRDAAFGGTSEKVLAEGQTCYIEAAPNRLQIYDGATWRPVDLDAWTAYTPTVTAGTGTITSATATGFYAVVGKTCFVRYAVVITSNGTGATSVKITLPLSFAAGYTSNSAIGVVRETSVTGEMGVLLTETGSTASMFTYNNGYPGGTGRTLAGSATYEVSA